MEKRMYSLKDLSEALEINVRFLRDYIKQGRLRASKIGRSYWVSHQALESFLDQNVVISSFGIGKG